MTVKIMATLPPNSDANGLNAIQDDLVRHPGRAHLAIVVLTTGRTEVDHTRDNVRTPKVLIEAIEVASDPARAQLLREMLTQLSQERTGRVPLPGLDGGDQ